MKSSEIIAWIACGAAIALILGMCTDRALSAEGSPSWDLTPTGKILVLATEVEVSLRECDSTLWTQADRDSLVASAAHETAGTITLSKLDKIVSLAAQSYAKQSFHKDKSKLHDFCIAMTKAKLELLSQQNKKDDDSNDQ